MNDTNENPLPPCFERDEVLTVWDFLTQVGHPAKDMRDATIRYGRALFNAYKREHGRNPYTLRINRNGPVKVYSRATDLPLMHRTYTQWRYRQRLNESSTDRK